MSAPPAPLSRGGTARPKGVVMNERARLAEQRVREWDSHMKRIDELMARAGQVPASAVAASPEFEAQIAQIVVDRNRVAKALEDLRHQPFERWPEEAVRGHGVKGSLEEIGVQLEQLLTAVFARP